jgi:uncharacterized protein (DUF58 family)
MDGLSVPGVEIDAERLNAFKALTASLAPRRGLRATPVTGNLPARRRGRGSDIEDVRPWSFGDDVRHIDRNATARTGIAHVRRFHDETETVSLLILDLRPSMLFGTRRAFRSVAAAEALALAGWRAAGQGGRIGLAILDNQDGIFLPPRTGDKAMPLITQAMARANATALAEPIRPDRPLGAALAQLLERLPRNARAYMASALECPGSDLAEVLALMQRKLQVTVLDIEDAFSRDRPAGLYPFLTLGGRKGIAATLGDSGRREPRQWSALLRDLGIAYVGLDTRFAPEDMLRRLDAAA